MASQLIGVVCLLLYLSASCTGVSAWTHPAGRPGAARLLAGLNGDRPDLGLGPRPPAWGAQGADAARGRRGSTARGWRAAPGRGAGAGAFLGVPSPPSPPSPPLSPAEDRDLEQQLANAVGGLGVLTDLNSFFNTLQENLESMENLPQDDGGVLLNSPDDLQIIPQAGLGQGQGAGRPLSSPALMYSLRNHRPSYKTRNFVETGEPAALRRSNQHDPQLLWAGLGR